MMPTPKMDERTAFRCNKSSTTIEVKLNNRLTKQTSTDLETNKKSPGKNYKK